MAQRTIKKMGTSVSYSKGLKVPIPILSYYHPPYRLEYDGKYISLYGGDMNYPVPIYGEDTFDQFEEMVLVPVVLEVRNASPSIIAIEEEAGYILVDVG